MTAKTSMLHVRLDEELKSKASETLAQFGLTVSDAVRILLTRVAKEGALPAGLTVDPQVYDAWFRAQVQEALDDTSPDVSHEDAMAEIQAAVDRKRKTIAHS